MIIQSNFEITLEKLSYLLTKLSNKSEQRLKYPSLQKYTDITYPQIDNHALSFPIVIIKDFEKYKNF